MKVKDLIKKLQEMPQDEDVYCINNLPSCVFFSYVESVEYETKSLDLKIENPSKSVIIHLS